MSEKPDKQASSQQAQGVVNLAPGETAPKELKYEDFMQQLTQLEKQIKQGGSSATDAEIEAMSKRIADLEADLARRARKAELSKKLSELTQKLSEEGERDEQGEKNAPSAEAGRASGHGIVAVNEVSRDVLGNYDWYQDLLKAHKRLVGFQ